MIVHTNAMHTFVIMQISSPSSFTYFDGLIKSDNVCRIPLVMLFFYVKFFFFFFKLKDSLIVFNLLGKIEYIMFQL